LIDPAPPAPAPCAGPLTGTTLNQTTSALTLPTTSSPINLGTYCWTVQETDPALGPQMPPWSFTITTALPVAPILNTPASAFLTNDNTPTFNWAATTTTGGSPFDYQIQITLGTSFNNPTFDKRLPAGTLTYTLAAGEALPDGAYSWRVRAINTFNT